MYISDSVALETIYEGTLSNTLAEINTTTTLNSTWTEHIWKYGQTTPVSGYLNVYYNSTPSTGSALYYDYFLSMDSDEDYLCKYTDIKYPPVSPTLEIGIQDGNYEWTYGGEFNVSGTANNTLDNYASSIDSFLASCTPDSNYHCLLPFRFRFYRISTAYILNFNITYTLQNRPTIVYPNINYVSSFLGNSTNFANVPIKITSSTNGTLLVDDIRFDYAGGNNTIDILSYNTDSFTEEDNIENSQIGGFNSWGDDLKTGQSFNESFAMNISKISVRWEYNVGGGCGVPGSSTLSIYNATVNGTPIGSSLASYSNSTIPSGNSWNDYYINFNTTASQSYVFILDASCGTEKSAHFPSSDVYINGQFIEETSAGSGVWNNFSGNDLTFNITFTRLFFLKERNETLNITLFYSKWNYNFPRFVDFLEFIPISPTSKGVQPYGQTILTPILNLSFQNYGGKNANQFFYLNQTSSCVDLFISQNSTKPTSSLWNGTLVYYPLDIDLRDISGNNKHGLDINGDSISVNESLGIQGGAIQLKYPPFTATGIDIGTASASGGNQLGLNFTNQFSVIMWINMSNYFDNSYADQPFFDFYSMDLNESLVGFYGNQNYNISLGTINATGQVEIVSTNISLNTGRWYQIGYAYNNKVIEFYLNGTKIGNGSLTGFSLNQDDRNIIGEEQILDGVVFNGTIDEVRVYNRTLNSSEINELYDRTRNQYFDNKLVTNWTAISWNNSYLSNEKYWTWADYNCNATSWSLFNPLIYTRTCGFDVNICSEELT